jgi:hypothetical protein
MHLRQNRVTTQDVTATREQDMERAHAHTIAVGTLSACTGLWTPNTGAAISHLALVEADKGDVAVLRRHGQQAAAGRPAGRPEDNAGRLYMARNGHTMTTLMSPGGARSQQLEQYTHSVNNSHATHARTHARTHVPGDVADGRVVEVLEPAERVPVLRVVNQHLGLRGDGEQHAVIRLASKDAQGRASKRADRPTDRQTNTHARGHSTVAANAMPTVLIAG